MEQATKDILTPTSAPKKADVGAEFARLEQLTRDLNKARHPAIAVPEGVKVASDGEYSAPSGADGATTTLADPIFGSPIPKAPGDIVKENPAPIMGSAVLPTQPQAAVVAPPPPPPAPQSTDLSRIFFTGRSGSGKTYLAGLLGAAEFTIQSPIVKVLADYFPVPQGAKETQDFLNLVIMWGEGYISDKVPITATRLLFADFARQKFGADFGKPGFWTRRLLDDALNCEGQSVITTVTDEKQFTALKEAGFTHFHVMASNPTLQTRRQRQGANNELANTLDNQVMKALSMQREGPKIRAIWCDQAAPPLSARLYDIGGFLAEAKGAQPASGSVAGE